VCNKHQNEGKVREAMKRTIEKREQNLLCEAEVPKYCKLGRSGTLERSRKGPETGDCWAIQVVSVVYASESDKSRGGKKKGGVPVMEPKTG